jgi:integrase
VVRGWLVRSDAREKYGDDFYDIQIGNHSPERRDELIERLVTPAEREAFRLLKPQAKSEPRLSDALALYLNIHAKGHVDIKFTQLTTLAMNVAIDTLGNPTLASITRADARKVRDNIKGVTATVRRRLRVIVAVVNKAILELNLPITNPFKQLEIVDEGQDHEARKPFTADEHLTIAEACKCRDDEVRWLMALILDTGMRLREAAGLRVEDVSLEASVPFVNIRPHRERALKTKGSQRLVPLVGTASACPFFSSKAPAVRANIFIKAPWLIVRPNRSENACCSRS